ncbi:MAG TPA: Ig-like domain repeat protein, partial [Terracidiphilus sp.]
AYSGDANYNASPAVTLAYSVVQSPTAVAAHAGAAVITVGSPVTLTANVTSISHSLPPSGTVSFSINGTSIGTASVVTGSDPVTGVGIGTATLSVPASQVAGGNNQVVATYSGDTNFLSSTSSPSSFMSLTGQYGTNMTMTESTTTATNTTPVSIVATLTLNGQPLPLGFVNFMDNGKTIATVPVVGLAPASGIAAGTATLTTRFTPGSHQIVGIYSGAGNLVHPTGNGLPPITVTETQQLTVSSVTAKSDAQTPGNYDVTGMVIAGGSTAPTGTLTLQEPSLRATLNTASIDPSKAVMGPAPEIPVATGSQNAFIITGDFNGDGIPDFAGTSNNLSTQLVVSLGNGDGTFKPAVGSVVSVDPDNTGPNGLVAGDFNADGIQDIAISFANGGNVVIMLGNGDGTFRQGQIMPVPPLPGGYSPSLGNLVAADFNSDGIQDIALTNDSGTGTASIEIFYGNGDGTFSTTPVVIPNVGSSLGEDFPVNLRVADVNRDGKPDLIAFIALDGTVGVLLGNGDGTFQPEATYASGETTQMGDVGDLNHDGFPDIVAPNLDSGTISVFLNNGDGTFGNPTTYQTDHVLNPPVYYYPDPSSVVIGDLNNDGNLDVVIANRNTNQVTVLYGKADGTLQQFTPLQVNTAQGPYQVVLADLNNDGNPDILVNEPVSGHVGVLINGQTWTTTVLNVPLYGAQSEQETLTASYSGDSANMASTAAPLTLAGSNATAATKLDWTPSATTSVFGTAIPSGVLDASVENNVPGAITYTAQLVGGAGTPVASGEMLPAAGAYSLTATFTPTNTNDYAPSTASIAFNVTKASVAETLASSASQVAPGASFTVSDVLVSKISGTPTGVVTFFAGTSSLGSATIDATGTATLNVATLPAGNYSITASYLGDGNFNTDTAAAISVVVGAPSISLAIDQSALTISAGGTGTETLTVTPVLGYTGNVTFSCGNLSPGITCAFAPASGSVGPAGLQSTLTITTVGPSSSASAQSKSSATLVATGSAAALASILLIWLPGRRKRVILSALLGMIAASALFVGCSGGGGSKTTTPTGPEATTLSVSSSATKVASGSPVTLTAALTGTNAATATGNVTFYDGTTKIGQGTLSGGSAQLTLNTLTVGAHSITASYAGDSNNVAATTASGIEEVVTGQVSFTVTAISGSI